MCNPTLICHHCCEYISDNPSSMKKHFNRKNICPNRTNMDYKVAEDLTLNKNYYFDFDSSVLTIDHFIYIIYKYKSYENYVPNTFLVSPVKNDDLVKTFHESVKNIESLSKIIDNQKNFSSLPNEEVFNLNNNNELFKKYFYDEMTNKYKCPKCSITYTSKQNLLRHYENKNKCSKRFNTMTNIYKDIIGDDSIKEDASKSTVTNIGMTNVEFVSGLFEKHDIKNAHLSFNGHLFTFESYGNSVTIKDEPNKDLTLLFDNISDDFYEFDYDNEDFYKETKGYIYIIRIREYCKENKDIYTIGFTLEDDVFNALNRYPIGSELVTYFYVINAKRYINILFMELDKLYVDKKELHLFKDIYGDDHYKIDLYTLYNTIYYVIKYSIIRKANIMDDVVNNKFHKLFLYYNPEFNSNIYNAIIKSNNFDLSKYEYQQRVQFFKEFIQNY